MAMLRHWLKITQASDYEVLGLANGFRHFLWNSCLVDRSMGFCVVHVHAFRYVVQLLLDLRLLLQDRHSAKPASSINRGRCRVTDASSVKSG